MVVRVFSSKASLLKNQKEMGQASKVIGSTAVVLEQCPYQVHDKVEDAKGDLKNSVLFPKGDILCFYSLSPLNASICELIINCWNCLSVNNRVISIELELDMVDIIINKNIALNTRLFNGARMKTILLCFVAFGECSLFVML